MIKNFFLSKLSDFVNQTESNMNNDNAETAKWTIVYSMLALDCSVPISEAIWAQRIVIDDPLDRLIIADPHLEGVISKIKNDTMLQKAIRLKPAMVISRKRYDYLLQKVDPILREELQNGTTDGDNHYFSPQHFCYNCELPFLDGDLNHVNHKTYSSYTLINYPFHYKFVCLNYRLPNGIILPQCSPVPPIEWTRQAAATGCLSYINPAVFE